jgi:hypothetical protein
VASSNQHSTHQTHINLGTREFSKLRLFKALLGPKSRISGSWTEDLLFWFVHLKKERKKEKETLEKKNDKQIHPCRENIELIDKHSWENVQFCPGSLSSLI